MAQSFTSLYAHSEWKNQRLTAEEIRDALADFELFASLHYIPDKNKKMVRFKLNEPQRDFAHRILQAAFGQEPGKEEPKTFVVLKSRRIGITFVCILLEQYIAMRKRNLSIVHLFPTTETSQILFNTSVKEIYSGTHPQLLADNTYVSTGGGEVRVSKFMGTDINSTVMYASFNTDRRGTGFQILMLDEWAMCNKPSDVERIFVNTVPKTGFAILVYISTAKGVNHFYDLCELAQKPDSGMEFLFYPWHEVWWNQLPPKKKVSELGTLTPEEAKLVYIFKEKGYPPETWLPKLAFFQDLERKNSGDMEKILSEWPATAEEAFTNTGKPVFPVKKLRKLYDKAKDAKFDYINIVPEVDDLGRRNGRVTWGTVDKSCIKQYKGPERGHRYVIGIDPSSGLEESDYTAMVVVDEKTLETVATFYGRVEPDDSATIAVSLAKLYNMAVIVPESNMGEALIGAIVNIGYPRLAADPKSSKDHPRYGIRTTVDSKEEGIARMRFFLLRDMWKTTDIQFVDDALHFQYTSTPSGRQKAEAVGRNNETNEPYHDDMVMANIMVCLYLNMQRWRDYYIYVDGNPNKMQRLASVTKGTFVLQSNQMETPRNVVIRNYGRRTY